MKLKPILAFVAAALIWGNVASAETITLTDVTGHEVSIDVPVKHMILGEGRFLPSLGILDPENPVRWVAGMMGEFKSLDPGSFEQYRSKFPEIDDIPLIGRSGEATFSVEKAITVQPDVAIFGMSGGHGPGSKSHEILSVLGVTVVPSEAYISFIRPDLISDTGDVADDGTRAFIQAYVDRFAKMALRLVD